MPTVLYLRGCPGSGKHTVARILERDLGWPRLWVHHFDAAFRVLGDHRVPRVTDKLMRAVAEEVMLQGRDLIFVRPSRDTCSVADIWNDARYYGHQFVSIRLAASYQTLVTRVERRRCGNESPFRLTTKEALDEYLNARPEQPFPGEHVIDTDRLMPEQVAGRIKELLPTEDRLRRVSSDW